jgi:hypothetical protein
MFFTRVALHIKNKGLPIDIPKFPIIKYFFYP